MTMPEIMHDVEIASNDVLIDCCSLRPHEKKN